MTLFKKLETSIDKLHQFSACSKQDVSTVRNKIRLFDTANSSVEVTRLPSWSHIEKLLLRRIPLRTF